MKKSPVAGISGSIRADCLTRADLTAAEKHGKRLDKTSKARAITKDPPVTTTGLDLRKLYEAHVSDAFVPKCKTVAKHIIVQFPKELVDGEDAEFMLRHARKMVERIFGDQAIFADRVDRDEKGRHIVDIFVAPKHIKETKHTSRLAVTVSVHEEKLAEKHGLKNSTYGRGRAMQDSIFEYFRDVMQLPGVQRGNPKTNPGPDWKNAEALREDELAERLAEADALVKKLEKQDKESAAERAKFEKLQEEAELAAQQAAVDRTQAASELADAKEEAANIRRNAQQEREREAQEAQQIREQLAERLANVPQVQAETAEALEEAEAERFRAVDERRTAARLRAEAEEEKRRVEEKHDFEKRQHALLVRASDDDEGLNLRTKGDLFEMNKGAMTPDEIEAYRRPWSKMLIAMARNIAHMLERFREATVKLLEREKTADSRMAEAMRREADAEERARQLAGKQKDLADQKLAFERDQVSHRAKAKAFEKREASHAEEIAEDNRWRDAIALAVEFPQMIKMTKEGSIEFTEAGQKTATGDLQKLLKKTPPVWVSRAVKSFVATSALADQKTAEKLAVLDDMIASAGPTLSPKQKETVSEARKVMKQFGMPPPGVER